MGSSQATCVTCGTPLHPERAEKYDYCTAPECQEQNAKGLTMVAVGVNKAADQYQVLDERTREDAASGTFHDQRRGSFGEFRDFPPRPERPRAPQPRRAARPAAARRPWTEPQQQLARIYNARGMRPAEIAQKLGVSSYLVTQMLLAAPPRER